MVLIFAAASLTALRLNRHFDKSSALTDGILQLLKYIKLQIELNRTPIDEIFKSFTSTGLEQIGFLQDARKDGFDTALLRAWEGRLINEEEYRLLSSFAQILGKGDAQSEGERCAVCIESYSCLGEEKKASLQKKKKVTLAVTAAIAGFVVIILI